MSKTIAHSLGFLITFAACMGYAHAQVAAASDRGGAHSPNTCLAFDGVDDLAMIQPDNAHRYPGRGGWTVECWIKPLAYAEGDAIGIMGAESLDLAGFDPWELSVNTVGFGFRIDGPRGGRHGINFDMDINRWHHVAMVYSLEPDVRWLRVYVDGELYMETETAVRIESRWVPIRLGGIGREFGRPYFRGLIDELRIWHAVLDERDLAAAAGGDVDPADERLVGWWPMDEGRGVIGADITGRCPPIVLGRGDVVNDPTRPRWLGAPRHTATWASSEPAAPAPAVKAVPASPQPCDGRRNAE